MELHNFCAVYCKPKSALKIKSINKGNAKFMTLENISIQAEYKALERMFKKKDLPKSFPLLYHN